MNVALNVQPRNVPPRSSSGLLKFSSPVIDVPVAGVSKQRKSKGVKRVVRFDTKDAAHFPSTSFNADVKSEDIWYSKEEMEQFSKDGRRVAHVARKSGQSTNLCVRGLEHRLSRRATIEMQGRKAAVIQAVLREQQKQKLASISDPSRIRKKSLAASWSSRQLAFKLADQDVLETFSETRKSPPSARKLSRTQSCIVRRTKMIEIHVDRSSRTIAV